ncbi:MAG: hypothetical protein QOC96_2411 [Acidobacteriota bacterium]|nr:hypothetical protein [Acidobacteriota bacterium]
MYESLDELYSLSGRLAFPLEEYGTHYPTIELLQRNKRGKDAPTRFFPKKDLDICEILKIEVEVPLPVKAPSWVSQEDLKRPAKLKSYYLFLIRQLFLKRIHDLLVIANLARIGALTLRNSRFVQDGNRDEESYELNVSELRFAAMYAEKIGWPKLQKLKIAQSWKWALQRKGFLDGFSEDATSRALNSFTHLLKLYNGPIALFWAIMGIEALYVRGREPKMEQVRERTQVLLGEQTSFKKKISEMYNFRSSFIHGGQDFPGLRQLHDATAEVESHASALNESTDLAIALLTATLQVLISRDWQGLRFSYKVEDIQQ